MSVRKRTKKIAKLVSLFGAELLSKKLGKSPSTIRRWAKTGLPKGIDANSIILDAKEVLSAKASHYYKLVQKSKRKKPKSPSDSQGFNKGGKQETARYKGYVQNKRIKTPLNERNLEDIKRKIESQLAKLSKKQRKGRYIVTFSMFEFGKHFTGSPGKALYKNKSGEFIQTFDAIQGANTPEGASIQAENILSQMISHPQSSVIIDSFTVKRYEDKTIEETHEWRREKARGKRKQK